MNATVAGLMTGLALGFAGYFGGFGAFVVVAVVGLAGLIVGWLARREGPVTDYLRSRDGRRPRETFERSRSDAGHRATVEHPRSTPTAAPRTDARARRTEQRTRVR